MIAAAQRRWKPLFATAAATGMRQSELLALRWGDVDLQGLEIRVRHQLTPDGRLKPRKAGGRREIEIGPDLAALLREHKMASAHKGDEDFVFATFDGKRLGHRNVAKVGREVGDRAGLNPEGVQPVSTHDFRHGAISRWIAAGLDLVVVQRLAGHKSPTTTLTRYSHEWTAHAAPTTSAAEWALRSRG